MGWTLRISSTGPLSAERISRTVRTPVDMMPHFPPDGKVWFAGIAQHKLGMFDPRTETWKSWRAPAPGGSPIEIYSFNVDRNDVIWFSQFGANYIGRFDPRTERFAVYPHKSRSANCRLMDIDRNGEIWCAASGVPQLVRLKTR